MILVELYVGFVRIKYFVSYRCFGSYGDVYKTEQ